jgi:TolB-like protein/Tfp pilus assembly protein PilF
LVNREYTRRTHRKIDNLEKSIAVLPLKNWSQDEEYSYLGDAMANEIILQLQNIHDLRVIAFTSALHYKDNPKPIPEIAEELGINYIIEGGIQRHENNLSIRVQLIRAKHEDLLWGEEYDGEWKDIFNIQNDIAKQVANQLYTILTPEETERIEKDTTDNPEAYRLYLKARHFWRQHEEEPILTAVEYCNQALEIDSAYALAWSGLADCYGLLMIYASPPHDLYDQAVSASRKALKLDNTLGEAYSSIGFVNLIKWKWQRAEENYIKAAALSPNNSTIHARLAAVFCYTGKIEKAIEEMEEAHRLDPMYVGRTRNLGMIYLTAHKYDDVIKLIEEALDVFSLQELYYYLGQAYLYKGLYDKALSVFQSQKDEVWTGVTYAFMGEMAKANQILSEILVNSKSEYISPFHLSLLYFGLDQADEGFRLMEKACDEYDGFMTEIRTYPLLDKFSSDKRYQKILKKMGLE